LLQTVEDVLRWTGISLVPVQRATDYGLDYPFPVWNVDSHTDTYATKRTIKRY